MGTITQEHISRVQLNQIGQRSRAIENVEIFLSSGDVLQLLVCTYFLRHAGAIAARNLEAALAPSKSDETKDIENLSLTTVILHISF